MLFCIYSFPLYKTHSTLDVYPYVQKDKTNLDCVSDFVSFTYSYYTIWYLSVFPFFPIRTPPPLSFYPCYLISNLIVIEFKIPLADGGLGVVVGRHSVVNTEGTDQGRCVLQVIGQLPHVGRTLLTAHHLNKWRWKY